MTDGRSNLSDQTSTDREERLLSLLEELIEQGRRGQSPDWPAIQGDHPDLVDELRQLWATAMIAEDVGSLSSLADEATWIPQSAGSQPRAETSLPRQMDDYELLEEIGRGAMGVVYKARQISLGRIVALKMILRGQWASAADVARFRAEAESAARLNHPHIVPIYDVGQYEDQPYFSMKYVEGTTLAKRLQQGPLPPREAARLLLPVARAIAQAHRAGILHRDLKASNILIDQEGRPHVTDFGLAKRLPSAGEADPNRRKAKASLTDSGAILGTPGYMAPEQAAGRRGELGPASDVYSLGAILYAMLTGRPPFQAASPADTVLMLLEQDPVPPRVLNHQADPDLEMMALKCLQKPIDLRYSSPSGLADDLEAYLAGEPIAARSSHLSQILSRAFRESHHAGLLENWGLLWMWHSLALLILCFLTNAFQWSGIVSRLPYVALWTVGLGTWAAVFWELRRRAGPITFVERQIAHLWAGSMIVSTLLFGIEAQMGLEVLRLSPVLALVSGMVFLVKAGILSGAFYMQAAVLFLTALAMAFLQEARVVDFGISLFGVVLAWCFFLPGLKYYRQRRQEGR